MNEPRKWSLILTGPQSGCIAPFGDTWPHSPEHFERVPIMEIPAGGAAQSEWDDVSIKLKNPPIAVPIPAAKEPSVIVINAAVDDLARSLGIVYNDMIPHNAGWFVPGFQKGYASAADAIRGLFAVLKQSGLSRAVIEALPDHEQPSLF